MAVYKVEADELPVLFQQNEARRRERVIKAIQRVVLTSGPALAVKMTQQGTARKPAPIDRATYLRGWQASKLGAGAVLYNDTAYATIIERGRRPGSRMPPLRAILEWAKRKGIGDTITGPIRQEYGPRRDKGNKSDRRMAVLRQQMWIALQIARKIAARGLPAHRIMARTKLKLDPLVRDAVRGAMNGQEED